MTERFTLLSELGRGGMGVVWKARDEESGQVVALKVMREAYAEDADYVTRFERELELSRRINSDHVVKVLGFGVRERLPYLALEYVDGQSLHQALASHGPYSWPEARALLIQITQGLADAHAADIIHRDVKPSNVLISADGVAKLTDFGIARGLDLSRMTATSTMLGTPAYLAPEGPVDTRSDLYSLGIIGYELLSGAPPFVGSTYQQIILAHVRTAPDLEKMPGEARPVIGWLLAKDAEERPQNGQELLAVLRGRLMLPGMTATMLAAYTPVAPVTPPSPTSSPAWPFGPPLGVLPAPASFRWRDAGRFSRGRQMAVPRVSHASTLMGDGRVLLTGGWDGSAVMGIAELFDPVSGQISGTGTALWARMGHTATLIPDGRVLVAGGCDTATVFSSTEIYDPTIGSFSGTGSFSGAATMRVARESNTATLMPNGRILMIGGFDRGRSVPVGAIEEFDPATGLFSRVGELLDPRSRHAATALADGRVLITGGLAQGHLAEEAELYDPRTQETAHVGRLKWPRQDHTAVVLQDGRVLIAGGTNGTVLSSAETYLPGTIGFTALGAMREPRSHHTATVLPDGRVLVAGGSGPDRPSRATELFSPGSNSFTTDASMVIAREGHTATLLNSGAVLIAGGTGPDERPLASTEVYSL